MRGLAGKGVLVTGGSSGIGLATARRFLDEGARVHICGIESSELERALAALGASVTGTVCDVSREAEVERLFAEADGSLGAVDVLVNNAGIARKAPFLETRLDDWDRVLAVNLRGVFLVAQTAARRMTVRGGGVIVNMASTNALGGEEGLAHYNASKGGVLQLTRTMAVELGGAGVRVNCVCPGFILTPLNEQLEAPEFVEAYARDRIPLGRVGSAEEVAAVFAFLASDEASFVHGEALVVDGGQIAVM